MSNFDDFFNDIELELDVICEIVTFISWFEKNWTIEDFEGAFSSTGNYMDYIHDFVECDQDWSVFFNVLNKKEKIALFRYLLLVKSQQRFFSIVQSHKKYKYNKTF